MKYIRLNKHKNLVIIVLLILVFESSCSSKVSNIENIEVDNVNTVYNNTEPNNHEYSTDLPISTETSLVSFLPTRLPGISEKILICQENIDAEEVGDLSFYDIDLTSVHDVSDQPIINSYGSLKYNSLHEERILYVDKENDSIYYLSFRDKFSFPIIDLYKYNYRTDEYDLLISDTNLIYVNKSNINGDMLGISDNSNLYTIDSRMRFQQLTSSFILSKRAKFSPDGTKIAFVAENREKPVGCNSNDDFYTELNLFYIDLNTIEDVSQISSIGIGNGNCGWRSYNKPLLWDDKSTEIIYVRETDTNKEIVCLSSIENYEEICFPEIKFAFIESFDLSESNYLVISGVMEPFDFSSCGHACSIKDIPTELFTINLKTGEFIKITNNMDTEITPHWVDNQIIYSKAVNDVFQVFLTDNTGSFHKQLTFSENSNYVNGMCLGY